jgi:hypothetical protein
MKQARARPETGVLVQIEGGRAAWQMRAIRLEIIAQRHREPEQPKAAMALARERYQAAGFRSRGSQACSQAGATTTAANAPATTANRIRRKCRNAIAAQAENYRS